VIGLLLVIRFERTGLLHLEGTVDVLKRAEGLMDAALGGGPRQTRAADGASASEGG
jgi:hypothetical protein